MLVKVSRNADGSVDAVHVYPETLAETRELGILVDNQVNLKSGVLFLNKEPGLVKRSVECLGKTGPGNEEGYRHT